MIKAGYGTKGGNDGLKVRLPYRGTGQLGMACRVTATRPLHCLLRAWRTLADGMPRDNALETEMQTHPARAASAAWADGGDGALPWVRLSQRDRPPSNRRLALGVLILVLAGHAVVVWLMWGTPPRRVVARRAISVSLIEPGPALPAPPPLIPPPPLPGQATPASAPAPAPPPVRHHVARAPDSTAATLENAQGKPLDLYGAKGKILLPNQPPSSAVPAYRAPKLKGAPILTIKNPVKYKPTRFNKAWAPLNQTLGGKLIDKAVDATTLKKTVRLPTGDKLHCAVSPLLIFAGGFGCHGDIPPPPSNDDDIRLSMPPAETLTGKKVVLPSSAASTQPPASSG